MTKLTRLKPFLDIYRSNSGMRGPILKLLSATGYASVVGYAGMLVLVRLYPEASFGLFDFVISIVGILTPFVSLRYEDSLMLADNDRDSAHSFLLAIGVTIGLSLGLYLLLPFGDLFAGFFGDEAIATWLWIIPPILIAVRYVRISELWLSRREQFGRVSLGQITYTTTMTGVKIGGGFISTSPAGLIFGFLVGWLSSILVNLRRVIAGLSYALAEGVSFQRLKYVATRYRRFPFFTMPAAFISMLGLRLPFLVLAYFFSLETVGYFGRAFNVVFIPLSLIGAAIAQVFFVRAVEANRDGTLAVITEIIHKRLVFLAWFPVTVIMVAGPEIFQFLLGETWRMSGVMARYIAPWILFSAVASPLSRLFDVLERQQMEFATNLAMFVVVATGLIYGGLTGDLIFTLQLLAIGGTVVRIWQIVILMRMAGVGVRAFIKPYFRYALLSLPWLALTGAAVTWSNPAIITLVGTVGGIAFLASVVFSEGLFVSRISHEEQKPESPE
ncbi:MAG: hypothetical protein BMS9Abin05_0632 [Rhodothermia bacterium]|nr:MAG: hypothetical protein BMS9Abin05_0632 [Rhodothermia bacterium]